MIPHSYIEIILQKSIIIKIFNYQRKKIYYHAITFFPFQLKEMDFSLVGRLFGINKHYNDDYDDLDGGSADDVDIVNDDDDDDHTNIC